MMEEWEEGGEFSYNGWQDDVHLMSDVHVGCPPEVTSCTTVFTIARCVSASSDTGNVSKQTWDPERHASSRELEVELVGGDDPGVIAEDSNGDLVLSRRPKWQRQGENNLTGDTITIHHQLSTRLLRVGLQIWRGALLLADFILETMSSSRQFHNVVAIELGAGTGLSGIVMVKAAKQVFITDRDEDILDNCARNVLANTGLYHDIEMRAQVRKLDWSQPWPPVTINNAEGKIEGENRRNESAYDWSNGDLEEVRNASVLLAADVIYSPALTEAFFEVLDRLMSSGVDKTLFLTLEKRFNFSLNELDVIAHGYDHFRSFFHVKDSANIECKLAAESPDPQNMQLKFDGWQIPTEQVRQHVIEYERGNDLELWKITRCQCQTETV